MASGGNDADLKYYNLEREEGTVYSHHTRKVLRMTVHPEHAYSFMSCSADGTVRMIDTRRAYESSHTGPIETVQGRGGDIRPQALGGGALMEGFARQRPQTIESSLVVSYPQGASQVQLYSVDFNPMNGHQFIVASEGGDVRQFDLRAIRNHSSCSYINIWTHKIANQDDITGCAYSKDGKKIVMTALNDAIYTFDSDFNFEKEANFPLCLERKGFGRLEVCDGSEHAYTADMLKRFHDWQPHPKKANPNNRRWPSNLEDSNEEDGEDVDIETEEDGEDFEGDSNEDSLGAPENALASRRARWERRRQARTLEEEIAEDEDEDEGDEEDGEDNDDDDPLVLPQVQEFLDMLPANAGEGETLGMDLVAFLQLASSVANSRRRRAAERRLARAETEENADSTSSSSPENGSSAMDVGGAERTRTSEKHARASPHGPHATNEPEANTLEARSSKKEEEDAEGEDGDARGDAKKDLSSSSSNSEESASEPKKSKVKPKGKLTDEQKPVEDGDEKRNALNLPQTYLQRFSGHSSMQTIKGVGFWGPDSEFVVSGSDDACSFIWDARDATLLNVLEGHDDVVNCVIGHPHAPIIATSGIDDIIILWEPCGPSPTAEEMRTKLNRIVSANNRQRRFGRQIQCGTQ